MRELYKHIYFYSFNYVCIIDSLDSIYIPLFKFQFLNHSKNELYFSIISINSGWLRILSKKKKRQIRIPLSRFLI